MRPIAVASVLAALLVYPFRSFPQQQPDAPQSPPLSPPPKSPPQQSPSTRTATPPTPEQQDAEARKKLEAEIAKELGQGGAKPAPAPAPQGQPAAAPQGTTGGSATARLLLLPDISAIGSFAGAFDNYDVASRSPRVGLFGPKDKPTPIFEELELGLQSVIDPYARADIFISFTPDGVDVEEAYATTLSLPAGLQIRAGKFFSPFGRQNQQHPHLWDFVDAPLARDRLVASEVLSGPGIDIAWLAPLPWFTELHVAAQGTKPFDVEGAEERLTGAARLLQYFPLEETTTLGFGVSAARRDEASGGAFRDLGAVDAYLRWRPLQSRSYLALQAELYARKFRNIEGGRSDAGGYAQLFWRQNAYYGYGVRYDNAPVGPRFGAPEDLASGTEHRYGAVATWFPSEFQRLRLQLSYDQRPAGQNGIEALLALEIGIGSHGAHPF